MKTRIVILALSLSLLLGGRVWVCTWVPDPLRAQEIHYVTCEWQDVAPQWAWDIT